MKKIFLIVTPIILITCQSVICGELTILTENLPPLNYVENGVIVGPSVEIVKQIQKRVGSKEQIQVYPWARAYQLALDEMLMDGTILQIREKWNMKLEDDPFPEIK